MYFSNFSMRYSWCGDQTLTPHSKCKHTRDLYSIRKLCGVKYIKFLLTIPSACLPLFPKILLPTDCSEIQVRLCEVKLVLFVSIKWSLPVYWAALTYVVGLPMHVMTAGCKLYVWGACSTAAANQRRLAWPTDVYLHTHDQEAVRTEEVAWYMDSRFE